ncbi:MAG: hypothetical protein A2X86_06120 [Bdellovibrionales bacterium GWA2_49_15]|nr:MAG: hypothetical protein A2X86_06120 [Bdellovibrionales bacterium GWA2_49_15]HAZ14638.1 hypothetical protein [Bdellovibrionales bacterium]
MNNNEHDSDKIRGARDTQSESTDPNRSISDLNKEIFSIGLKQVLQIILVPIKLAILYFLIFMIQDDWQSVVASLERGRVIGIVLHLLIFLHYPMIFIFIVLSFFYSKYFKYCAIFPFTLIALAWIFDILTK